MKLDLFDNISRNFKWHECLYLPRWDVHAFPNSEEVYFELINTIDKMQLIRDFIDKPIIITSMYRPLEYNKLIGGANKSNHIIGMACDFKVKGQKCDVTRKLLLNKLEEFDIRMENNPGSNWVHIDTNVKKNGKRYFKP